MKKHLTLVGALLLSVSPLFAQEEETECPGGWLVRGPDAAPQTNAPIELPALGSPEDFSESGLELLMMGLMEALTVPAEIIDLGLPQTIPASDFTRIKELARGLDYDWIKCYRFVRDHITYAPYYGIVRGPERTLLDREGNDADQAFLLLALLRASGHEATVVYEPLEYDEFFVYSGFYTPLYNVQDQFPHNAAAWLDVPSTGTVEAVYDKIWKTLDSAGRPATGIMAGTVPCLVTDHFWVELTMPGGSIYRLDPSFKPTVRTAGRDLVSDMGYNREELIAAGGGVVSDWGYVGNLSASGLETN